MRILMSGLVLASSLLAGAARAESCGSYRQLCETTCTPPHVSRYYAGSPDRCLSSCGPRYGQCLRTGWWADLERRRTGGWLRATSF